MFVLNQSPFFNLSIFDKYYFNKLFENFYFPDGTKPNWETLDKLQKFFMKWFNEERKHALLTFPVVTMCLLHDNNTYKDEEYARFTAQELSNGNAFFVYTSDSVDSLSSCCFRGDEKITYLDKNDDEVQITCTIKDFVEHFRGGERIISYNTRYDDFELTEITGVLKKPFKGKLIAVKVNGDVLRVTPDHLFWVRHKYSKEEVEMSARELADNSTFLDYEIIIQDKIDRDIKYKSLVGVFEANEEVECDVYDIELKDNHYFFANGILTHNCRLRNSIKDQLNDFSYSLGAGGVMTGSMNVLTLNMNRFIQNIYSEYSIVKPPVGFKEYLKMNLEAQIRLMHMFQIAFKKLFRYMIEKHMLNAYDAHFIELDKQYLTIGINGLVEGAEYLGYEISNNQDYKNFVRDIFRTIHICNKMTVEEYPEWNLKLNTEMVPAENLGVKFAKWDRNDDYYVPRDCYNSYLYRVEDDLSPIDKLILHGKDTTEFLDGGAAAHINLEDYPSEETCRKLLDIAAKEGCFYFCFNVKVTVCNKCGYIDKRTMAQCSKCGSTDVDYATRVIGYLKRVSNFSKDRQLEETRRCYNKI